MNNPPLPPALLDYARQRRYTHYRPLGNPACWVLYRPSRFNPNHWDEQPIFLHENKVLPPTFDSDRTLEDLPMDAIPLPSA